MNTHTPGVLTCHFSYQETLILRERPWRFPLTTISALKCKGRWRRFLNLQVKGLAFRLKSWKWACLLLWHHHHWSHNAWCHSVTARNGRCYCFREASMRVFEWLRKLHNMYKCVWDCMSSDVLCVWFDACVNIDKWDVFHALAPCCNIVFISVSVCMCVLRRCCERKAAYGAFVLFVFVWMDRWVDKPMSTAKMVVAGTPLKRPTGSVW